MTQLRSGDLIDGLFYANLGEGNLNVEDNPQQYLLKYLNVLKSYNSFLKEKSKSVKFFWKKSEVPEGYDNREKKFAITLELPGSIPPHERRYANEILERIVSFEFKSLCCQAPEKNGKLKFIKILDTFEEENLIILDSMPTTPEIFPDMNDVSIRKEVSALKKLINEPREHHLPLLALSAKNGGSLLAGPQYKRVDEWMVLTDNTFPGVDEQRSMVIRALSTENFAILEGPPGSGKTTVISEIILQMLSEGKRILLVGSTHVAVDNVLEKLLKYKNIVVPIRIAPIDRELPQEIRKLTYSHFLKSFKEDILSNLLKIKNKTHLQEEWIREIQSENHNPFLEGIVNDSINLVSGTSIGVLQFPQIRDSLSRGSYEPIFDAMILDEASKTTFQEFLVPAMFSKKWILSGDPKQLSPYTEREFISSQVEALIRKETGTMDKQEDYNDLDKVCLISFRADRNMSEKGNDENPSVLILLKDNESKLRDLISDRIKKLQPNKVVHIVNPNNNHMIVEKIIISGSDVIIMESSQLHYFLDALPYEIKIVGNIFNERILDYRYGFIQVVLNKKRPRNRWENKIQEEGKTLSGEIAWRLVRSYELRRSAEKAHKYKYEIERLIPGVAEGTEGILSKIDDIKFTGLPSIIEILISGNGSVNPSYKGSIFESGLEKDYKEKIWLRLSKQYRMHPEISRYPRELVYTSEDGNSTALIDSPRLKRDWNYNRYNRRVVWLDIRARNRNGNGERHTNRNETEADKIIDELKSFVKFASSNGNSESTQWTVALLSFYKDQTRYFQRKIREMKNFTGRASLYFSEDKSVKIFVGNVDSMQGREADIVFLSMVRSGGLGFLDNTNRVNVAITRAKYQLVIVGNHKLFSNPRYKEETIYKLAKSIKPDLEFKTGN